jgi:hypothetical protein
LNHTGGKALFLFTVLSSWLCTTYAKKNGAIRKGKKWQQRPQAVFSKIKIKIKIKIKKGHTTPQAAVNSRPEALFA